MEVSIRAKERFCKDCNIPIRIFQEPYFTDRLTLYDKFYGTLEKWDIFLNEIRKYRCEQDYFEEYNHVKDTAILAIKNTKAHQKFNEEDMNKYVVTHKNLPNKDIFKSSNDGKCFISIDMKKANFSSLHHYSPDIFGGANSWEEFIGRYTDNRHIINSKYIRQVILGNCNSKRQVTYEKHIMEQVLEVLIDIEKVGFFLNEIAFFSNDEIVIDMEEYINCIYNRKIVEGKIKAYFDIPFKVELFYLRKIKGVNGYYKEIIKNLDEREYEFKCLNNYILPFVLRKFQNQEITENDKVFYHEGLLSKFIKIPEIEVNNFGN